MKCDFIDFMKPVIFIKRDDRITRKTFHISTFSRNREKSLKANIEGKVISDTEQLERHFRYYLTQCSSRLVLGVGPLSNQTSERPSKT